MMNKRIAASAIAGLPVISVAEIAYASGNPIQTIGTNVNNGIRAFLPAVSAIGFLLGIWFFIQGWLKMARHKDDPRENPISSALLHLIGGGGLMFITGMSAVFSGTLGLGTSSDANYFQP